MRCRKLYRYKSVAKGLVKKRAFIHTHSVQHANLGQKWPQISGSTVVRDRHREPTGQRARARWNRLAIPLRMPCGATAAASSLSSSTTAAQDASDPMFVGDLHPHDQVKGNTSPRNCDSRILGGERRFGILGIGIPLWWTKGRSGDLNMR